MVFIVFALPAHGSSQRSVKPSMESQQESRIARVPILSYHLVRPSYPRDDWLIKEYLVTSDVFDEEMNYLSSNGYHVIPFSALEAYIDEGTPLPPKPVIISFDDGWENQFAYAFPILQKYRLTATFFIYTNAIDSTNHLTWGQVKTMSDAGMVIGSHSLSHPFLAKIADATDLWREIADSKKIIEEHIGKTVNEFAYPYGSYNQATIADVEKAGYKSARKFSIFSTSVFHSKGDMYALSAIPAPNSLPDFERALDQ